MLADKTYKRLKNMIYDGRLQPGQRLVERDLSRTLSVSRIPLREGLVRLESEGLVRSVPNSATYVEDFSFSDIVEMYSMRLALEPLASRLATFRRDRALVPTLKGLCEQMTIHSKEADWAKLDRVDYEFHRAIVGASGHSLLIRAYDNCHIQITGIRAGYAHLKKIAPDATAAEHQLIVDCIRQGNGSGAEDATYDHVRGALTRLAGHFGPSLEELGLSQETKSSKRA
jgi:DNA-binding GntR family transcriptional regulator